MQKSFHVYKKQILKENIIKEKRGCEIKIVMGNFDCNQ